MNTRLDDMFQSDEFRQYRKRVIAEAVRLVDLEDQTQTNEYRAGLIALLRKLLRIPCQGDNKEIMEKQMVSDMNEFKMKTITGILFGPR